MATNFIPYYHFVPASQKLTPSWCMEVVNDCYYNTDNKNLLYGKDVKLIEEYSSGNIDMLPFKKMFTSLKKAMINAKPLIDGALNGDFINSMDTTGLSWTPLPLIPQRLNSAVATIQKILIEVQCIAQDALAMKKRKDDIEFLKNKSLLEADLQDLADQMGLGKVQLGETKNGAKKFSDSPMGLDLNDPDEENIFAKLLYSLNVEVANENALQQIYELTKAAQVRLLEIIDQFKFGVSVNQGYISAMSASPSVEYIYPGDVSAPESRLPDGSDRTHIIVHKEMTVLEMFNYFGDEICDEETLEEIINGSKTGYCSCNKRGRVNSKQWGSFKVQFKLIEAKSIDWAGIQEKPKSQLNFRQITTDPNKCSKKIWGQNTYRFWWLVNTEYVFGIEKLPFAYRTKGVESYQNFSLNIYKSQPKSAVELSIGENRKAQIADIKLEHCLIKSLPPGKYVDLHFLRNALQGLTDEGTKYTQQDLINMVFEHNIIIGDSEGFDGKNDGQMKPFVDIPGGLKAEVTGYINVILNADRNISNFTGINEQLTGQSPNPEGLVGLEKILINQSINAIHYAYNATQVQYQSLFQLWANHIQYCIKSGGAAKKAIVNFIGMEDTDLIDGLNQTPLHNLTIKALVGQREIERNKYEQNLLFLKQKGVISMTDDYLLSGIENPKERFAYLAVKEKRFLKKQDEIRKQEYEQQQILIRQQGENAVATEQAEGENDLRVVYAKGEVQAKILERAEQLGLTKAQAQYLQKLALQRDRGISQKDKGLSLAREKANLEQQKPL